ncbi:MAG: GerMN domain-containing protein, partial [Clostridia bacterium]|nr:GerMN domain-containing protein [Clostridia bacterium]
MKRAAIIAAVLCLLLSGCVPLTSELHPLDSQYEMPLPNEEPAEPAIGDAVAGRTVEATLYFPSADGQGLVPAQTSVFVAGGDTLPRRLAEALLETDPPKGAQPVAPEGTSVLSVLCSGGAAVVNLSIDARGEQAGKALLLMRAAIVRTLC